jgi:hypothetical protein
LTAPPRGRFVLPSGHVATEGRDEAAAPQARATGHRWRRNDARTRNAQTEPLTQRERYRLMLRFNLTSVQVDRLPLDIARTLLGLV